MPMMPRPKSGRFHPGMLFRPQSVAVVGSATDIGALVLANLRAGGFTGPIFTHDTPDPVTLPVAPDLVLICEDGARAAAALRALAERGTRAGVVLGAATGLRALAAETGLRTLGAGSFGIAVPAIGLNATRSHLAPPAGRVALVSQSGAISRAVLDWAEPNGIGFSHVVGIGANDDIGFALVLDWLSHDAGTGTILLDIRRIRDARAFLSAARAAARLRPVVALRAGARLADPSGDAEASFAAALRRCGVLCVDSLEDLLAAAETLTRARPARGDALAIVTNARGPGLLAADAALRDGLGLVELTPEHRAVIRLRLPDAFGPDIGDIIEAPASDLADAAALLAGASEVGGVLAVMAPSGGNDAAAVAGIAAAAKAIRVPLLACILGETTGAAHRHSLAVAGVPVFATPALAVRGFQHLVRDRRNRAAARELPPSTVLDLTPDRAEVTQRFHRTRAAGRLHLSQDEAMAVLACYGVPTVPCRPVSGGTDAAHAADLIGYPVVLKRRRADRPDPADRGAIALDLHDAAQVRSAAALLEGRGPLRHGEAGFLVQRQLGRARELRLQVRDDPLFGPVIRIGQGGTAADALHDIAVDLPPLNLTLARGMIARTRVAVTFAQLHDQPAANAEAVAETVVRVSQLLVEFPEIAELDINPLFVDSDGVMAADAWIRLRPPGERAHHAIPPYPAELAGEFHSRGGRLLIRPIRPEDAAAHAAFFARLPPEDVRYRFFSAMRELSAEQIARLTQIDYDREMAFVAVREETGETVGVARLVREFGSDEGEFAIAVQPDAKGGGLARHLMERLIAWGRSQGMREMVGQILSDNRPMLAFVRRLGFTVRRVTGEPDITEARLALTAEVAL